MVEVRELLRKLEGVLREISRFRRRDALLQNLRPASGPQPQRPDIDCSFPVELGADFV